ncbi:SDR family oxidoreductase [Candidatus Woesearchaeota archaeon]|nr:SDR family oxidoreductase [Candidatus Woesearchaeota archaeon]
MMRKVVVISGGTEGIGKATVVQLLSEGFNVVTFSRENNRCKSLNNELKKNFDSETFIVMQADVTNEKDMSNIVNKAIQKFKKIDVLINNAGFGYFVACDRVDIKRFQEMVQTNIVGVALLTKLTVPYLKKQNSGLIINLVSISGKMAFAQGEFYSATKFALMGYSEGIRKELKDYGIKVSTLCPGMIKTNFFDEKELERRKKLNSGQLPTFLEVEDVVRVISFVCHQSPHSDIQDVTIMPF